MVSILIPALNEEKNILTTVSTVKKAATQSKTKIEIIIVNDGSTDKTPEIIDRIAASSKNVRVIHHQKSLGIGTSVQEALEIVKYPKFIVVPGDNDLSLNLITNIFKNRNKADVIMAYFLNREIRGRRRNTLSTMFHTIHMITFNIFVQYVSGPCLYPTEKLRNVKLCSNRFSIYAESIVKVMKSGCTYLEIPGYLQTGMDGSTSLSMRNLIEVIIAYIRLISQVYFKNKSQFSGKAIRIFDPKI